jgi:sugar/nucleoside kinase (ribokinase family)
MKRERLTFDVVVVSGAGIDTNVYLPGRDIDWNIETNFTENLDYVGQAGGYSSRGFAQLGKKVALIDAVGKDYHGKLIREVMNRDGINTSAMFVDPKGTRRSINFMYSDGRRKNFYDGKGSMEIKPPMAKCRRILKQTKLAHFNIINWSRYLLPVAKELGVTVSCDIQDVVTLPDAYRQDYVDSADVLFFSAVNQHDPAPVMRRFLAGNSEQIVIAGMGARGCALGTNAGIQFFPPVEINRPVIDTNGAGDGLAVGFLSSYFLDGYSLEDSVLRGQIAARHTCSVKANSSGLITRRKLDHWFRVLRRNRENIATR